MDQQRTQQQETPQRSQHDICRSDDQCLNEGICIGGDTFGSYTRCDCQEGYGGERCEDHCPLDCSNQGICVAAEDDSYHCKCFGLFAGPICSIPYVNCKHGVRCYNGGACVMPTADDTVVCECPPGYIGATCRQQIAREDPSFNGEQFLSTLFLHQTVMPISALIASFGLCLGAVLFSWLRNRRTAVVDHRYTGVELQQQDSSTRTHLRNIV